MNAMALVVRAADRSPRGGTTSADWVYERLQFWPDIGLE
jgi:hypothetical protein